MFIWQFVQLAYTLKWGIILSMDTAQATKVIFVESLPEPMRTKNKFQGCKFFRCKNEHHALGFCETHYKQSKRGKNFSPNLDEMCSFKGCKNGRFTSDLCRAHHAQRQTRGYLTPIGSHLSKKECKYEKCHRVSIAKGYCDFHYRQKSKNQELTPAPSKEKKTCSFHGCNRQHLAKNFCRPHHAQSQKGVELKPLKTLAPRLCDFGGCDREHFGRGLCGGHYDQKRKGKDLRPIGAPKEKKLCEFGGCDRLHWAGGFCQYHHEQKKNGKKLTPVQVAYKDIRTLCAHGECKSLRVAGSWCLEHVENENLVGDEDRFKYLYGKWIKGRKNTHGYIIRARAVSTTDGLYLGQQRQPEHRGVMESHLGRKLLRKETVHHINGIRDDNRIENLELWSSQHPSGQRVVDKLAWAREIIELYEKEEYLGKI